MPDFIQNFSASQSVCFSLQSQPHAQSESGDYPSSTLPLTKREKQHISSQEPHPLGAPRNLGPVHPPHPGYLLRRASIASPVTSPEHHAQPHPYGYPQISHMQPLPQEYYNAHYRNHTHHKQHHSGKHSHKGKRMLPLTPNEEPYHHQQQHPDVMRPHSRAESQPDPLPMPWRPNFAPQSQLVSHQNSPTSPIPHSVGPPPSHTEDTAAKVYPAFKEPLLSPTQPSTKSASKKKLSPLRPKSVSMGSPVGCGGSLSRSIDGLNLKPSLIEQPGSHTVSGVSWQKHRKVVPLRNKRNSEGTLLGWSSVQRLGQQPADIQSLMSAGQGMPSTSLSTIPYDKHKLDITMANMHEPGSTTSVEISPEMFAPSTNQSPAGSKGSSPQASTNFRPSPEIFMGREGPPSHQRLQHPLPPHRSVSAKPSRRPELHQVGQYAPEHSNSMEYVGMDKPRQLSLMQQRQELPNLDNEKVRNAHEGWIYVGSKLEPQVT